MSASGRPEQTARHSPPTGRRRRGGAEQSMVPEADFRSYYGMPVVKAAPWGADIPAYMFFGGLSAGSSLLAAGADLTGRGSLRRAGRLAALVSMAATMATLVHDLGRPARFGYMLRTVKLTSPMSVGSWILSAYGPVAGVAAVAELADVLTGRPGSTPGGGWPLRLLARLGRPAGLAAGLTAPPVAAYTAVLLADTATPTWHEAYRELPFVFVGSAAAAAGGLGMVTTPVDQAGPARRMAVGGAVLELLAERQMESSMGVTAEPLRQGRAGRLMKASRTLTAVGAVGTLVSARSRALSAVSGAALLAASVCTRFGVFEAGQASAADPRYTVVPQQQRARTAGPVRPGG